ncbi:hypothetical protein [Streptomyces poonensis]|uniref:Uncharacterized protein n=1 Tax=Streptomyces poonensis TaxID=68255 RepID=A0A918UFH0_9ACTN|nr:hypothetical protein [Streptomyces poonensis]GGZ00134.1 hypothetical protein GCM10010365_18620 [Streptomyces poonensis]GLJ92150.1 hypothetical protein GCM10017589_47590 [Streptomyces poonensis]
MANREHDPTEHPGRDASRGHGSRESTGKAANPAEGGEDRRAPIGKGDNAAMAGSDVQQPEIAEGPVEGLQPGERVERGPWRPPLEVDPPSGSGLPRDAAGEPDAVREQKKRGGP